ncbi:winged helix DNA-binding domain-containing protein [Cellulomonas wangsupingiae]|uniref:Winged helix DNA-binding domain-containing protein n=1 Tax=Cellulomonas wangsupingiae TaxID=2968085 RepID=A0ABY5K9L3_9CELL|nr:winged helix DNA-binding domain-containing protein [Cellulomonas wangsupingiae]MCC2333032.1 winged helix DNA-binding domain-containing protein [Cellulomonas wangsupingiae]UUI66748.1 winged helix DNA-binding domain-containing protein [Cellulomonas wangsupingiae]
MTWRAQRQHLTSRLPAARLTDVVSRLAGVQAQLLSSVQLALWARTDGLDREALTDALWRRRSLVKLWGMRGTLHVLPTDELATWLAAFGTYRGYGMDDSRVRTLVEHVGAALDEAPLTRAGLADAVLARSGSAELAGMVAGSWGLYLKPVAFRGQLCFADGDGTLVRFSTPARWTGAPVDPVAPATALRRVARRFLAAHGPATEVDLARWWGVGHGQSRRMLQLLGDEVRQVRVAATPAWALAEHLDSLVSTEPTARVHLLPAFDQLTLTAPRDERAVLPAPRARVFRDQGWVSPVLLRGGRVAGVWRHRATTRRLTVELEPFARWGARARATTEREVERLASFLGGSLTVTWLR